MKDKAKALVGKYYKDIGYFDITHNDRLECAKQCALICVNRTIRLLTKIQDEEHLDNFWTLEKEILEQNELKQEIEKL